MMYLAVVKYAVDDPPAAKVRALVEGLEAISCELIEQHGWELERVLEQLEDTARTLELDYQGWVRP